jgi:Cu+-exporting ATPase
MKQKDNKKDGNLDPVCGMTVTKENAACSYEYKGMTYYFCAQSCKDEFAANPASFLQPR